MSCSERPTNYEDNRNFEISSRSQNSSNNEGKAVPDAVHERLKKNLVYCDNCQKKLVLSKVNIHKHFNTSHQSEQNCVYCSGKVFYYYKLSNNHDIAKKLYYHRCKDWSKK